jgi:hypothetical protein
VALAKKLVSAIQFINDEQRDDAVLSLVENSDLLYPVYANVLWSAKQLFYRISAEARNSAIEYVAELFRTGSHVVRVDLNAVHAVRFLSCVQSPENEELLNQLHSNTRSVLLRRDIILAMAKWRAWYWLSDLRATFRTMSPAERRSFIIASYVLTDEGKHWRDHISDELSPFEAIVRQWASEKVQQRSWDIPL